MKPAQTNRPPLTSVSAIGTARPGEDAATTAEVGEVVAMLDTLHAADLETTIADLEGLLTTLRPATRVRQRLLDVPAATLRHALRVRADQTGGGPSC